MITSDLACVDANVLVYAGYRDTAQHSAARFLLDRAQAGEETLCLTPQVLAEFYSVVTNPRRVTPARPPQEVLQTISRYLAAPGIVLLPTPVDVVQRWMALAQRHPVSGADIFDLQLVATMSANGVSRLFTFNTKDFEVFDEIEVMNP